MSLFLSTPRLLLRPFEERDVPGFSAYRSDPEVARYQGWDAPYTLEQASRFVSEMQAARPGSPGEWYQLAIQVEATGELAGDCAFKLLDWDPRQAEVGLTLATAFQQQGYGREAMTCLLDYLFNDLRLHRVRANCDPANLPAKRSLERLGFRFEGRFVESLWYRGAWADEDWYAILQREWPATAR